MNILVQSCSTSLANNSFCAARSARVAASAAVASLNHQASSKLSRQFGASSTRAIQSARRPSPSKVQTRSLGAVVAAFGAMPAKTELAPTSAPPGQDIATFAGGCFWGLELAYQREPGVTKTSVGYTQGSKESPTYQEVCSGRTGHTEAVQVYFDPKEVTYERLLDLFFDRVDPTTKDRQGNDAGTQYRSGIYYHNDEQRAAIEAKVAEVDSKLKESTWRRVIGSKVVSEVKPAGAYWLAEKYHQQYLQKGGQNAEKGASDRIRCYG